MSTLDALWEPVRIGPATTPTGSWYRLTTTAH